MQSLSKDGSAINISINGIINRMNKTHPVHLITERPTFLSIPFTEVGIPVSRANFCFAAVIPSALFQLKLKPYFPIMVYLYQGTE